MEFRKPLGEIEYPSNVPLDYFYCSEHVTSQTDNPESLKSKDHEKELQHVFAVLFERAHWLRLFCTVFWEFAAFSALFCVPKTINTKKCVKIIFREKLKVVRVAR